MEEEFLLWEGFKFSYEGVGEFDLWDVGFDEWWIEMDVVLNDDIVFCFGYIVMLLKVFGFE